MIGLHASITPTILDGIKYVNSLGGKVIQIFTGGNKSSSLKVKQKVTDEQALEIKDYLKNNNLYLSIHAIYLLNFCTYPPISSRIKYAHDNIIYDLELAEKIGAFTVVLHLGYQKDLSHEEAYNNMADNVIHILKTTNITAPNVSLSLETPAGQGSQICSTLDEFKELLDLIDYKVKNMDLSISEKKLIKLRLKICVDTTHIFSSGYDIRTTEKLRQYFKNISNKLGANRISLIHLNDSKQPLNSRKDQHEGLGDGYIFKDDKLPLKYLMSWALKHNVPIVLETHKAGSPSNELGDLYAQEVGLMNSILDMNDDKINKWHLIHKEKTLKTNKIDKRKLNKTKKQKRQHHKLNENLLKKIKEIYNFYVKFEPDAIRARAYNNAYLILYNYPEEIRSGEQVEHLKGIGKQMVKKINEYLKDGEMQIFRELINPKLAKLKKNKQIKKLNILGFGEKKIEKLASEGYDTYSKIKEAYNNKKITLNNSEILGLKYYKDLNESMKRNESLSLFNYIKKKIIKGGILDKYDATIEIAGSYPSGKKESKDLDILIFTNKYKLPAKDIPDKIINEIADLFSDLEIYQKGNTKLIGIFKFKNKARHVDIRLLPLESEIAGRLYFTSGRDFNVMIRQYAISKGFLLNEYGLFDRKTNQKINLKDEYDLFDILGLSYIPMKNRRMNS